MPVVEVVIDLETTANGPNGSPEAHYPVNKCLMAGWKCGTVSIVDTIQELASDIDDLLTEGHDVHIIGHNLKFDMKYLLRDCPDVPWEECFYFCTMTGEYLKSGHLSKFSKLEDLAAQYGVTKRKTLDLGALLSTGIKMEQIDKDELEKYLRVDLEITEELYKAGLFHNWMTQHILPLAAIELNGMPLDMNKTRAFGTNLLTLKDRNLLDLEKLICGRLMYEKDSSTPTAEDVKLLAPRTMSYILTGEPRTGLKRTAKYSYVHRPGYAPLLSPAQITMIWGNDKPTNLGYKMTSKVQDELAHLAVIQHYKIAKDTNKLLATYIQPFLAMANETGGTVNSKYNTTVTATGRLSSTDPNGQNIPEPARKCMTNTQGALYEIDFSQLEIVGAATLSGCANLIDAINKGLDIHEETASDVFGPSKAKQMRKPAKGVNFGVLYGGGANGLSETTGLDAAIVKRLIKAFFTRFPGVQTWQNNVEAAVKASTVPHDFKNGEQRHKSTWVAPADHGGRRYTFIESESPFWMKKQTGRSYSFKPTEMKNYPIQGFAGGDIVMLALWHLYRLLPKGAMLRATVHDSIVVDWEKGKEKELREIMNQVCSIVERVFKLPVKLKFDIESDSHWQ